MSCTREYGNCEINHLDEDDKEPNLKVLSERIEDIEELMECWDKDKDEANDKLKDATAELKRIYALIKHLEKPKKEPKLKFIQKKA